MHNPWHAERRRVDVPALLDTLSPDSGIGILRPAEMSKQL